MKFRKILKNLKIFFVFTFLNVFFFNFLFANIKYTDVKVELKEINPINPKASDLVKLTFLVSNEGTKEAEIKIDFLNPFYYKLVGVEKEIINVPAKSYTEVSFFIKIYENVSSGKYPINIVAIENNNKRYFTFFLNIKNPSYLEISSKEINNCKINEVCKLKIVVMNKGFSKIKNLLITPYLPGETLIIKEMRANSIQEKDFEIFITEDLNPGFYLLKMKYSFLNEENNLVSKEIYLPINLMSNVDLAISSFEVKKDEKRIKLKIENPGDGKAKRIKLSIKINNKTKEYYLSYLDEDEDVTVYFDLKEFDIIKNQENNVEVILKWYDSEYKEKKYNFSFYYYEKEKSSFLIYVVGLLIILILAFLIKNKKVKENEE